MIDAFEPAVRALQHNADMDLHTAFVQAANAAAEGVENTKKYVAKYGRAQFLGERAIGIPDAGATSVQIIFEAMRDYLSMLA